jgi:hypothetical protein
MAVQQRCDGSDMAAQQHCDGSDMAAQQHCDGSDMAVQQQCVMAASWRGDGSAGWTFPFQLFVVYHEKLKREKLCDILVPEASRALASHLLSKRFLVPEAPIAE